MKCKILLLAVYSLYSVCCLAQTTGSKEIDIVKELTIGERCPDFEFQDIINYTKSTAHLSDFKGKLIILDFWATWCSPCIAAMPELDSLQIKYKSQIKILPVTYESKGIIRDFLNKSKKLKNVQLSYIVQDTLLRKYFNYRSIPHEVWIDGNGFVKAITNNEQVTAENIKSYLDGKTSILPEKKDIIDFNLDKPLLLGGTGNSNKVEIHNLLCSSILTGPIKGMPGMTRGAKVIGDAVKIIATNTYIHHLFQLAFSGKLAMSSFDLRNPDLFLNADNRVLFEVKDSSRFFWAGRSKENWNKVPDEEKMFCYELILPKTDSNRIYAYLQKDLNKVFGDMYGIEGSIEKRNVKCWVLVRTETGKLHTNGATPDININKDNRILHIRNTTIKQLLFNLVFIQQPRGTIPVIDGTGYNEPIDLDIKDIDVTDMTDLGNALKKWGLNFILSNRELDMIVIADKKKLYDK